MKNPYLNRVAIRDVGQFYGRRKELARIYSRIGASRPQSVSVVGERRIGKSSLINYIYAPSVRAQQLDGAIANYIFIFMDLQQKRYLSIEDFFSDLLTLLSEEVGETLTVNGSDFDAVRKVFADLHKRGRKIIILFDEFDAITTNRVFSLDFFAFLRSAANNYDVAYITSSAKDLQVLCHTDQIADSPFFNIFTNVYLRTFTYEEALGLIRDPSSAAGVPLEPYARQIIDLAGYFPFFLQIACANYFEHICENGSLTDESRVEEGFLDEARVHFRYTWEHFHQEERDTINSLIAGKGIAKNHMHVCDELRRAGYILEGNPPKLFSRLFAPVIARLSLTPSSPALAVAPTAPPAPAPARFIPSEPRLSRFDSDEVPAEQIYEEAIPPTDPAITNLEVAKVRHFVRVTGRDGLEQIRKRGNIGRFEILGMIGRGGMGEVLLARDRELMRQVAIKLLKPRYASDDSIRRRFLREAQTASMLNHPNIATIYEIGEVDDLPYIVMEYIPGKTLSEMLRVRPFTISEIIDIGTQSALALAEAHTAGIIHRDVKSSNILVSDRGQVKVLDFGLAKPGLSMSKQDDEDTPIASITEPGILMGTVTYMSPEQASGKDVVDHRSDIFSLGIVLYEITTGKLPFDGATYFQIIEAITKSEPIPILDRRKDAPAELVALIMKTLEKNPELRISSAAILASQLRAVTVGN